LRHQRSVTDTHDTEGSKEEAGRGYRTALQRRLRAGGILLILAGVFSFALLVSGATTLDAQNGEVEYFGVWLQPWFLLVEIMFFTSTATVSIVGGTMVLSRGSVGWAVAGGICSVAGLGFVFGVPGLILGLVSHRAASREGASPRKNP